MAIIMEGTSMTKHGVSTGAEKVIVLSTAPDAGKNRYATLQEVYDNSVGDGENPTIMYVETPGTIVTNINFSGGDFKGYQWIAFNNLNAVPNPKSLTIRNTSSGTALTWRGFPSVIDGVNAVFRSDTGPVYNHSGGLITELRGNAIFRNYGGNFFTISGDSHIILRDRSMIYLESFIFTDDTSKLTIYCYDQSNIIRTNTSKENFDRIIVHILSSDVGLDVNDISNSTNSYTIINQIGFSTNRPTSGLGASLFNVSASSVSVVDMVYNEITNRMTLTLSSGIANLENLRVNVTSLSTDIGTLDLFYCPVTSYNGGTLELVIMLPEQYIGNPITYSGGGVVADAPIVYLGIIPYSLYTDFSIQNLGGDVIYVGLTLRNIQTGDVFDLPTMALSSPAQPACFTTSSIRIIAGEIYYTNNSNAALTGVSIGVDTSLAAGSNKIECFINLANADGSDVDLSLINLIVK